MTERPIAVIRSMKHGSGLRDPHPALRRLRAFGEVVHAGMGSHFVLAYQPARQVLAGRDWLVTDLPWSHERRDPHPAVDGILRYLLGVNPPLHRERRRAHSSLLSAEVLEPTALFIGESVSRALDRLEAGPQADFCRIVSDRVATEVGLHILGLDIEDASWLPGHLHRIGAANDVAPGRRTLDDAAEAWSQARDRLRPQVAKHAAHRNDDLICFAKKYEPDHMLDYPLSALIAIAETTASLLNSLVIALDAYPRWRTWLAADTRNRDCFVDEVLRWSPPVQVITRRAVRTGTLAGVEIPPDARVHLMIPAIHRDPELTHDPDTFRPDRGPTRHLAFGLGGHYCLGTAFALTEARLLLSEILRRDLHIAVEDVTWAPQVAMRRAEHLNVRVRRGAA